MTGEHTITIRLNVVDPAKLHAAAVASYKAGEPSAHPDDIAEQLGTADAPNVAACLLEIACPADGFLSAGFEIVDYADVPA